VYRATAGFPRGEVFGLTAQMRRACASIPSNLAEGCGRQSDAELGRFGSSPWARRVSWSTSSCWRGT
jgi:four helix bundle protein